MSKYYKAEDIETALVFSGLCDGKTCGEVKEVLNSTPTIDIVRCKECKWGKPYSDKQLECDALGLGGLKFPDDFCSCGERREP